MYVRRLEPAGTIRFSVMLPAAGRTLISIERDGRVLVRPVGRGRSWRASATWGHINYGSICWAEHAFERLTDTERDIVGARVGELVRLTILPSWWSHMAVAA